MKIEIPMPWQKITNGPEFKIDLSTSSIIVGEALNELCHKFESLKSRLFTEDKKINKWVNIYLGDEDIRFLNGLDTPINNDSVISIVPAVAGG